MNSTLRIYCIYDARAEAHLTPFFYANDSMANRAFSNIIKDDNHPFSKTPEDYDLVVVGEFDSSTGGITPVQPTVICAGRSIKA